MGRDVLRLIASYYESLDGLPVAPDTTSTGLRASLSCELPTEGEPFEAQLEQVREVVYPGSRQNGHPRFFGYVASPAAPVAALADLLAASLDATVTAWRSAPTAAEVEHLVIDSIREILGYPAGSRGVLVSGGSMANLCGIAAARDARAPVDVTAAGARALGAMRLYVSREGHFSIAKAAGLLGIGRDNVRPVPVDGRGRMDAGALARMVDEDLATGHPTSRSPSGTTRPSSPGPSAR